MYETRYFYFNTQDDLFHIHNKIHIFEVFQDSLKDFLKDSIKCQQVGVKTIIKLSLNECILLEIPPSNECDFS